MRYARQNALLHMQRMEALAQRRKDEERQTNRVNGSGSPEVVSTEQLAPLLNGWRKLYDKEYDVEYRMSDTKSGEPFTGPMQYLADQTGMPARRIQDIMNQKTKFTSLYNTEKLLMAIDREYLIGSGEITIVPNPNWGFKKWIEYMIKSHCYNDL